RSGGTERSVRCASDRLHSRPGTRPWPSECPRWRYRAGASAGWNRRQVVNHAGACSAAHRRTVRTGHHVYWSRPGNRHHRGARVSRFENILLSCRDGIGTVTLNRPDKLNAFAGRMRQELAEAVRESAADPTVRVLVITGAGRAFCAGADIGYMKELLAKKDWSSAEALVEAGREVVTTIRQ